MSSETGSGPRAALAIRARCRVDPMRIVLSSPDVLAARSRDTEVRFHRDHRTSDGRALWARTATLRAQIAPEEFFT